MKKLLLLFVIILASCSSNEDEVKNVYEPDASDQENIVGKWIFEYGFYESDEDSGTANELGHESISVEFKKDNTIFTSIDLEDGKSWNQSYLIEGDKLKTGTDVVSLSVNSLHNLISDSGETIAFQYSNTEYEFSFVDNKMELMWTYENYNITYILRRK